MGRITFLYVNRQVCFSLITPDQDPSWILAIAYASTYGIQRHKLWDLISNVSQTRLPLLLIGDFNVILSVEDKRGEKKFKVDQDIGEFRSSIKILV